MSTPPSRSSSSRAAGPAAPEGEQDKADERRGSARPVGDPHRGKNYKLGAVAPKLGAQPRSSGRSPERRRRSGAGAGGPEPARGPGPEPRAGKTGAGDRRGGGDGPAGKTGAGDRRGGGDGPAPRECQAAGRAMRGWRGGASSGRRPVRDPAPAARGELGQVAGSGPSAGSTTAPASAPQQVAGPLRRRPTELGDAPAASMALVAEVKSGAGASQTPGQHQRGGRGSALRAARRDQSFAPRATARVVAARKTPR